MQASPSSIIITNGIPGDLGAALLGLVQKGWGLTGTVTSTSSLVLFIIYLTNLSARFSPAMKPRSFRTRPNMAIIQYRHARQGRQGGLYQKAASICAPQHI